MSLPAFPTAAVERLAQLNGDAWEANANPYGMDDGGHIPNWPIAMNDMAVVANYLTALGALVSGLSEQVSIDAASAAAGSGTEASVAQVRAGAAAEYLSIRRVLEANQPASLTRAATTNWNMASGINFDLLLNGNVTTLANPTNQVAGKSGVLRVRQDGTGGRTIGAYGSHFKWVGGLPRLPSGANAVALISYFVWQDGTIYLTYGGEAS